MKCSSYRKPKQNIVIGVFPNQTICVEGHPVSRFELLFKILYDALKMPFAINWMWRVRVRVRAFGFWLYDTDNLITEGNTECYTCEIFALPYLLQLQMDLFQCCPIGFPVPIWERQCTWPSNLLESMEHPFLVCNFILI